MISEECNVVRVLLIAPRVMFVRNWFVHWLPQHNLKSLAYIVSLPCYVAFPMRCQHSPFNCWASQLLAGHHRVDKCCAVLLYIGVYTLRVPSYVQCVLVL